MRVAGSAWRRRTGRDKVLRSRRVFHISSLSGRIFAAFLVVLATFGGVTAYGAFTMRRSISV